jgi:hypothetical protein
MKTSEASGGAQAQAADAAGIGAEQAGGASGVSLSSVISALDQKPDETAKQNQAAAGEQSTTSDANKAPTDSGKPDISKPDDDVTADDLAVLDEVKDETVPDEKADEKEITPEVQKIIDKRIGKEVRKTKELREELSKRDAEIERLKSVEQEAVGLRAKAQQAIPVHSSYLTSEDLQLFKKADEVEQAKSFYMRNIDGYEDEKNPANSLSAERVRERLSRVDMQLGVVEQANKRYAELQKAMTSDLESWKRVTADYESEDALVADLKLAQRIRSKREEVAKKAKESDKNTPLPGSQGGEHSASVPVAAQNSTTQGFDGRRFTGTGRTIMDVVKSGF